MVQVNLPHELEGEHCWCVWAQWLAYTVPPHPIIRCAAVQAGSQTPCWSRGGGISLILKEMAEPGHQPVIWDRKDTEHSTNCCWQICQGWEKKRWVASRKLVSVTKCLTLNGPQSPGIMRRSERDPRNQLCHVIVDFSSSPLLPYFWAPLDVRHLKNG